MRQTPEPEATPYVPPPNRAQDIVYSVVIAIRDRPARVVEIHHEIVEALGGQDEFELIFIDDGSRDGTWSAINDLVTHDPARVRGLRFRRKLGTAAGLSAGFRAARGQVIFSLDPDSPISPRVIPQFLDKLAEGPDIVSARILSAGGRWYQELARRVVPRLACLPRPDLDSGFHGFRADAVKDLTLHGEHHRMLPTLLAMQGFQTAEIEFEPGGQACEPGRRGRLPVLGGFLDWLTLSFLQHYRDRPAQLIGGVSATFALFGSSSIALGTALLFLKAPIAGLVALIFGSNLLICTFLGFLMGLIAELTIRAGGRDDRSLTIAEGLSGNPTSSDLPGF